MALTMRGGALSSGAGLPVRARGQDRAGGEGSHPRLKLQSRGGGPHLRPKSCARRAAPGGGDRDARGTRRGAVPPPGVRARVLHGGAIQFVSSERDRLCSILPGACVGKAHWARAGCVCSAGRTRRSPVVSGMHWRLRCCASALCLQYMPDATRARLRYTLDARAGGGRRADSAAIWLLNGPGPPWD